MAAYSPGSAPAAFNLLAAAKRVRTGGIGQVVYAKSCLLKHDKIKCCVRIIGTVGLLSHMISVIFCSACHNSRPAPCRGFCCSVKMKVISDQSPATPVVDGEIMRDDDRNYSRLRFAALI